MRMQRVCLSKRPPIILVLMLSALMLSALMLFALTLTPNAFAQYEVDDLDLNELRSYPGGGKSGKEFLTPFHATGLVIGLLNRALRHLRKGEVDTAYQFVERALEKHPSYVKGQAFKAYLEYHRGNYQIAIKLASQVLRVDSFNKVANMTIGLSKIRTQDFESALHIFSLLSDKYPSDWKPFYHLGILYRTENEIKKSVEHFLKCIEVKTDAITCYNELAKTYAEVGMFETAIKTLDKVINFNPRSIVTYMSILDVLTKGNKSIHRKIHYLKQGVTYNSHSQELHTRLAAAYRTIGKMKAANRVERSALSLQAETYNNKQAKAYQLEKQGRLNEAAALLAKILAKTPDNIFANYHLAGIARKRGHFKTCVYHYRRILRIVPNHFNAVHGIALCYLKNHNLSGARKYLKRAESINPRDNSICINLGIVHELAGRYRKAIRQLDHCLDLKLSKKRRTSIIQRIKELRRHI